MTCNSNECSCYNVTMSDGTFVGVRQQYCLGASSWPAWYAIYPSSDAVHAGIPSATNAHYVSYELPTARSLSGYSIGVRACNSHDNPNHPSTWQMQGSNDYSSWTDLDSQTLVRFTTDSTATVGSGNCYSEGGASNTRQFNLSSPGTAYKYYRYYVTANARAAYSDATWDAYTIWDRMTLNTCTTSSTAPELLVDSAGKWTDTGYVSTAASTSQIGTGSDASAVVVDAVVLEGSWIDGGDDAIQAAVSATNPINTIEAKADVTATTSSKTWLIGLNANTYCKMVEVTITSENGILYAQQTAGRYYAGGTCGSVFQSTEWASGTQMSASNLGSGGYGVEQIWLS
jgi:hypothetical protein